MMEKHIDREITHLETAHLQSQSHALLRQNELLKKQVGQLKQIQANLTKELAVYKNVVFNNVQDNGVLEMQHQRIFELETQLEIMASKYNKIVRSAGSGEQTEYALRCRELERRGKDRDSEHQKEMAVMKGKLMKMNAVEIVEHKRLVTTPTLLDKSSLAVRKFF